MAVNVLYSKATKRDEEGEHVAEDTYRQIKELNVIGRGVKSSKCESCVSRGWYGSVSVFLCFVCEVYLCVNCMSERRFHEGMKVWRRKRERQTKREESEGTGAHSVNEKKKNKKQGVFGKIRAIRKKFGKTAESKREMEREKGETDGMKEQNEREKERENGKSERTKEQSERYILLRNLVDKLMNESERQRTKELKNKHVSICDHVDVKHELDKEENRCWITGLCGLEKRGWVVCDCDNSCIKIFKLGSHDLRRYIQFVGSDSEPWDVTEIDLKQISTVPNIVSSSRSDISATDRANQDKQCLIAVSLPWKFQIMFIDLSKKPAKTDKIIKTEVQSWSIQFYDGKIFTVCADFTCSVYIYSIEGDTLNKFNIGIDAYPVPYLAVVTGRVYLADWENNIVQCRNVHGKIISEITIEESRPEGISVDPDNNVYVYTTNFINWILI